MIRLLVRRGPTVPIVSGRTDDAAICSAIRAADALTQWERGRDGDYVYAAALVIYGAGEACPIAAIKSHRRDSDEAAVSWDLMEDYEWALEERAWIAATLFIRGLTIGEIPDIRQRLIDDAAEGGS